MLAFGHAGITMGVVLAGAALQARRQRAYADGKPVDFRIVLVAAFLPDLIDKPLWLLFPAVYPSGHAYAHALFPVLVLVAIGASLLRWNQVVFLLGAGSLLHLAQDSMWRYPTVLFWPLHGPVAPYSTEGWVPYMVDELFTKPDVYVPEIIGFVILLIIGLRVIRNKGVTRFLTTGALY